ncbi:MAG: DUF4493 domain-containing protein [Alistipes sp.]|nr:DUF4493 domain-containing protein [Alistipes senegalensis]MCM1250944.1 DUF4493 domain-containing protein [Alistipes sp.]
MKRQTTILLAAALLAGCAKEAPETAATGYGTLHLAVECSPAIAARTRAAGRIELPAEAIPAAPDLALRIESADPEYDFARRWDSVADYDSQSDYLWSTDYEITLFTGTDAEHPGAEASPEGVGCPYFEGRTKATVSVGLESTRVDITARLANTIVRIDFTDRFKGYFGSGADFRLTTAAGSEFDIDYTTTGNYYYIRPGGGFTISGEATKQKPSATQPAQTVKFADTVNEKAVPGTLYTYTFDVSGIGDTGEVILTLNDTPIRTETIDEELNDDAIPE